MIQKIEKYLQDLISGEISAILNLHEPDSFENSETLQEDIDITLPDNCSINCQFEWSYNRVKGMKGDNYNTPDDPDILKLDWLNIISFTFYDTEEPLNLGTLSGFPKLKSLMIKYLVNELKNTYIDQIDKYVYKEIKENKLMKFDQFINEGKIFIKHFRPEEYEFEIKKLSEWKNSPSHFYVTNNKGKYLEIVLYVHGKPTEKFIFDGDTANESKTITPEQMVKSFVVNVNAGWILKNILIDRESIEEQLIEHFDVTYGEENIQKEYPKEFKNAVNQLCKLYLKK
jgi:hypothetical protein